MNPDRKNLKSGDEVIFGRAKGFRAAMMRMILRGASWLFRLVVLARLYLFHSSIARQARLGMLVVSVGNITVGGTGKTPVVELLARTLTRRGRKVAILTRGYKSAELDKPQEWRDKDGRLPENLPKIASDGKTRYLGPLHSGDEPFMLAKNLDGVAVLVDKNRIKSGIFAIEHLGCDTLLLDDGMQYLKLAHELDIVLVDCGAPFGTGAMLPRGTLREPRSSLARASYIILTKCGGKPQRPAPKIPKVQHEDKQRREQEIQQCARNQPDHAERRLPLVSQQSVECERTAYTGCGDQQRRQVLHGVWGDCRGRSQHDDQRPQGQQSDCGNHQTREHRTREAHGQ